MRELWMALAVGVTVAMPLVGCSNTRGAATEVQVEGPATNGAPVARPDNRGPETTMENDVQAAPSAERPEPATMPGKPGTKAKVNEAPHRPRHDARPEDLAKLGLEVYPGAVRTSSGFIKDNNPGEDHIGAVYASTDGVDQVIKFYQEKYKGSQVGHGKTKAGGNWAAFVVDSGDGAKLIHISRVEKYTCIMLQHTIKTGAKSTQPRNTVPEPAPTPTK